MQILRRVVLGIFIANQVAFAALAEGEIKVPSIGDVRPVSFAPIVEQVMPAVVNISTTQKVEVKNPFEDFKFTMPDGRQFDMFKDFMEPDGDGGSSGDGEGTRTRKATSLGSGFVIDPAGYIVTNNHVISDADDITVTVANDPEKTYKAKIIGKDVKTDLALLKVESKIPLPFLKFGNADNSKVGDWVLAVGNPYGLGGSVTAGIISAKGRFIAGQYDEFIQTDASINRGNSGGPMLSMNGEVVGVNAAILSPSGGSVGIGFAIPSSTAQAIITQLKDKGVITRGWLGVKIQMVTEDIAKSMGMTTAQGALVAEVSKNSPSDKAGVKEGDIILKFDGKPINNMQKLPRLVAETEIGKAVKLEIFRDGKLMALDTKIEKLQEEVVDPKAKGPNADKDTADSSTVLGMKVETISDSLRVKYRIDKSVNGVVVTKVLKNSIASDVGVKPGDVIMRFNITPIINPQSLKKAFDQAKTAGSKNATFMFRRGDNNMFVVLDLG